MSHFAVLVITESPDDVDAALAPYHEFECTGEDNEYVQDVDVTAEARETYEKSTDTRYRDPQGVLHDPYQDRFYREFTPEESAKVGTPFGTGTSGGLFYTSKDWGDGKGYRAKVHFLPEGWEEVRVSTGEVETFAEWASDYYGVDVIRASDKSAEGGEYGYVLTDDDGNVLKVIDRTNPNARWDWWQIGGRYSGKLIVKPGAHAAKGDPGVMGSQIDEQGVDQARLGDLDLPAMLERNRARARKGYREVFEKAQSTAIDLNIDWMTGEGAWERWNATIKNAGAALERLREAYKAESGKASHAFIDEREAKGDPDAVLVRLAGKLGADSWGWVDIGVDMDTMLAKQKALSTFAVIRDGQWYERGKMGWWACVSDEKDEAAWDEELARLLSDLDPDMIVTVVDCHI